MAEGTSVVLDGMGLNSGDMDNFKLLLEHLGFRLSTLKEVKSDELSKGKVLLVCPRYEMRTSDQISIMLRAIRDGLGALILLDPESSPHFDFASKLLSEAGIVISDRLIRGPNNEEQIVLTSINRKHSITSGVSRVVVRNPRALILVEGETDRTEVLIRSDKDQNPPEAVVSCVTSYGNGKMVIFSSCSVASNDLLAEASNAIFLTSAAYWLANLKPPADLIDRINKVLVSGLFSSPI